MQLFLSRVYPLIALAALALLVCVVYAPGLDGPFVFDDAPNITENPAIKITELNIENLKNAAFSIPAGPLYRPLSFVSFAINYYLFELDTFSFKIVNLLIHLGVGVAIFWCAFLIFGMVYKQKNSSNPESQRVFWAALLVSAIFLIHPFNVSSVLYVVQRMNSLAALFMFISLGFYLHGRMKMLQHSGIDSGNSFGILMCWAASALVFFPLAIFSKENALLLPFLVLVIEAILFKWRAVLPGHQWQMKLVRATLWLGVVFLMIATYVGWDKLMSGYVHRDFSLSERLLTEPLILFRYLSLIILPVNRGMTFYHDDITVFSSLFDGTAFLYILFWSTLVVLALIFKQRAKWFAFAVLWFLVAHSIESTFIALELAHEHRNYVPMFGILLAFGSVFLSSKRILVSSKLYAVLAVVAVLVVSGSSYVRTTAWGNMASLVERQQRLNPESPRANYAVGQFLFSRLLNQDNVDAQERLYHQIVPYFLAVNQLDPTDFSGYLSLIRLDDQMGYPLNTDWLNKTVMTARKFALGQKDLSHVQDFLHCQLNAYCKVDLESTKRIVDAVLLNSSLAVGFETTLKADLGVYLSMNEKYIESARYFVDVVGLSPNWWVFRLAAVNSLIASGQVSQAVILLEETKAMDVPQDYKIRFTDLTKKISHMEK